MKKITLMFLTLIFMTATYSMANNHDLVEIINVNSTIRIDIKYSTTDNFTGKQVYPSSKCYVNKSVAEKLDRIQKKA